MGCEVRTKPVFGWVRCSFGNGGESFFVGGPDVFVEPRSGCVTCSANALEAGVVSTLIYSATLRDCVLQAGSVGAENDFGPSINVTVGE